MTANSPIGPAGLVEPLWSHAREHAAERGFDGLVWPYLDAPTARATAPAGTRVLLHSADTDVTVPANGLADRWRPLDAPTVATCSGSCDCSPTTEGASNGVHSRQTCSTRWLRSSLRPAPNTGSPGGPAWVRRASAAQRRTGVTDPGVVCVVPSPRGLAAAAVFYRWRDRLYGRYWGATPDAPPFSYFVLTQYAAVDWAAAHGVRSLHLSISNWEGARRPGAASGGASSPPFCQPARHSACAS
ncbi:GNAT family N-acetyltransferase [Actinomycetes bacterium KLBMP 9759]